MFPLNENNDTELNNHPP